MGTDEDDGLFEAFEEEGEGGRGIPHGISPMGDDHSLRTRVQFLCTGLSDLDPVTGGHVLAEEVEEENTIIDFHITKFSLDIPTLTVDSPTVNFSWEATGIDSELSSIELWRKKTDGSWQFNKSVEVSGGILEGFFEDSPEDSGSYEYGLVLIDSNDGMCGIEGMESSEVGSICDSSCTSGTLLVQVDKEIEEDYMDTTAIPGPVVISEIAWAGTVSSASDEWIELYNNTDTSIDLEDWILKADDDKPTIALSGIIEARTYVILERTNDNTVSDIDAFITYTGALGNTGEFLELYDSQGNAVDVVNQLGSWFAGNSSLRQSMARIDMSIAGTEESNWAGHDFLSGISGKDADDINILGSPGQANSIGNDPVNPEMSI